MLNVTPFWTRTENTNFSYNSDVVCQCFCILSFSYTLLISPICYKPNTLVCSRIYIKCLWSTRNTGYHPESPNPYPLHQMLIFRRIRISRNLKVLENAKMVIGNFLGKIIVTRKFSRDLFYIMKLQKLTK